MTDLAKKNTASDELFGVYSALKSIVKVLEDSQPSNIGNQLIIAEEFIHTATKSMDKIFLLYCEIMERGGEATPQEVSEISKQANEFFHGTGVVLDACRKIDQHGSDYFAGRNAPPELKKTIYTNERMEVFAQLLKRRGYVQQHMEEEARRLGSDRGGRMLQAVSDCALQLLDAVHAMNAAGVKVDLNHSQEKEEPKHSSHKELITR